MRLIINCADKGAYLQIISTTEVDINYYSTPLNGVIPFEIGNTLVYNFIKDELVKGKSLKIPKGISEINIADIIVGENDELELLRTSTLIKIYNDANKRIGSINNFYFFKFNVLNLKLQDKGYFITKENNNIKYLEILQTEDEELINILENYLNTRSKLEEYETFFDDVQKTILEIEESYFETEIINAYNIFNKKWS